MKKEKELKYKVNSETLFILGRTYRKDDIISAEALEGFNHINILVNEKSLLELLVKKEKPDKDKDKVKKDKNDKTIDDDVSISSPDDGQL